MQTFKERVNLTEDMQTLSIACILNREHANFILIKNMTHANFINSMHSYNTHAK